MKNSKIKYVTISFRKTFMSVFIRKFFVYMFYVPQCISSQYKGISKLCVNIFSFHSPPFFFCFENLHYKGAKAKRPPTFPSATRTFVF